MKITDKYTLPVKEPVPKRGDVLRVERDAYYLVAQHTSGYGNVLISLDSGAVWKEEAIPFHSPLSEYVKYLESGFSTQRVDHFPSSKLELVIGG